MGYTIGTPAICLGMIIEHYASIVSFQLMARFKSYVAWIKILLIGLLVLGTLAWIGSEYWTWRQRQQPFDYGKPTPLLAELPMRAAVCKIRAELAALPQPLVKKHYYLEAWTEYKFAAGRFNWGPFHEIKLTPAAQAFTRAHSRAELIAALAPLLADQALGGRAAAILGALPVRTKSALSSTSGLAAAVKRAQGGDPAAPIKWNPERDPKIDITEAVVPIQLYGLTNMGMHLERSVPRDSYGSFEARLEHILLAQSKLPMEIIRPTMIPPEAPIPKGRASYEDMIAYAPIPEIDPRFKKFLEDYPRLDILIALYPLRPLAELIWASQAQDRYWPLVTGSPLIKGNNPKKDFLREVTSELIGMCD